MPIEASTRRLKCETQHWQAVSLSYPTDQDPQGFLAVQENLHMHQTAAVIS